ncbi:galactokinase [candidate division KSB1 bacterium]|nr:galactokinase [candidate division KSB1 bacterium]
MHTIQQLISQITQARKSENFFRQFIRRNYRLQADDPALTERYIRLLMRHQETFGAVPVTLLRAPGRLELLGNHTDYNGCPVITMAIDRDLVVAASPRNDRQVVCQNVESVFTVRQFEITPEIEPYPPGDWGNYVKAAVQGLVTELKARPGNCARLQGFNLTFSGTIPAAAGLSSSSALVVAAALTFLHLNSISFEKLALAQLLAQAEKYVGTQGGGMDQTISLLGQAGHALKIDFNPYAVNVIPLPADFQIVVTHSLVAAPKSQSAMEHYNRRAIECRLATAVIKKYFDTVLKRSCPIRLIGDLTPANLGLPAPEILRLSQDALTAKIYTYEQIAQLLGLNVTQVQSTYCRRRDQSIFPQPADGFKLAARFQHVYSEWQRVLQAGDVLQQGNLPAFGKLMTAAQQSSRDLYEISTPELNHLVALGLKSGAMGSRLTGAGFGGCAIHLVAPAQVADFTTAIRREYYQNTGHAALTVETPATDLLFTCQATDGAGVISP